MKLLFRGEKFIDETFPDYLVRMAYWNGFRSLEAFSNSLKKIYRELYLDELSDEKSRVNLKNPWIGGRDSYWLECRYALEAVLKRNFCSDQLNFSGSTQKVRLNEAHFCHDCWKEAPYVRFYWRLDSYFLCHKHRSELLAFDLKFYHPDVRRLGGRPSDRSQQESLKSSRIQKFLFLKRGEKCTLKELLNNLRCVEAEYHIWFRVVEFMQSRFRVCFRFERLCRILASCLQTSLHASLRFEAVIARLKDESDATEKLLKVIALIFFKKDRQYYIYCLNFQVWAEAEAYSINPLFASFLFGIGDNLFGRKNKVSELRVGPVVFGRASDRVICEFIIDSGVFSDQELCALYTGGKYVKSGRSVSSGFMLFHSYAEYADLSQINIFDSSPVVRVNEERNTKRKIPL